MVEAMSEAPICTKCGRTKIFQPVAVSQNGPDDFSTDGYWVCPSTAEEHRLAARVHDLEAKLAEVDKGFLSYVEDVESLRYSLGKDVLDENLQLNNESVTAHAVALAREEARKKGAEHE